MLRKRLEYDTIGIYRRKLRVGLFNVGVTRGSWLSWFCLLGGVLAGRDGLMAQGRSGSAQVRAAPAQLGS